MLEVLWCLLLVRAPGTIATLLNLQSCLTQEAGHVVHGDGVVGPFLLQRLPYLSHVFLLLFLFFSPLLHISSFRFATTTVDLLTLFSFTVLAQPTRWICKQTTLLRLHILTLEKLLAVRRRYRTLDRRYIC